jgi:hypothetical protein
MRSPFDGSEQYIGGYGNPYLCLQSGFACATEGFDPQVLLDPFEEDFDLPATSI